MICRIFDDFEAAPSQTISSEIWTHLGYCTACFEKFQVSEGVPRHFLLPFEFANEIGLVRDLYSEVLLEGESSQSDGPVSIVGFATTPHVPGSIVGSATTPDIPGFRMERRLGRGASSEVWLARQEGLGRSVALKIMHRMTDEQKERLQKECRILASLSHSYLLPIFANGMHEEKVWMALEYCPGGSLNFHLDKPWDAKEAATLVRKIALAAEAVHEKGIIHRDIKPGNILIGADGEPKLADFDLARYTESGQESTRQTQILGTPAYIAPEQVRSKKVDARADVHALGGVLYHLLTERPPFKADSAYEVLLMAAHTDPVPPIRLRPSLPKDIDQICRKCLAKDQSERYQNARDLAADLERFCENRPVKARPLSNAQVAWRWAKRNRGLAATGLAAILALISVAVVSSVAAYQAIEFARKENKANLDLRKASDDAKAETVRARENEEIANWELYVNRINQAQVNWDNGDPKAALDHLEQCPFGLRGWEHHYLSTLFQAKQVTSSRHKDGVLAVAYSLNEQVFASSSRDSEVTIWNAKTGAKERNCVGHTDVIECLAFSPNRKFLAGATHAGRVWIWDYKTGGIALKISVHKTQFKSLCYSIDGKRIFCCASNGTLIAFETITGKPVYERKLSDLELRALAVSPDGSRLACAGSDSKIWLIDAARMEEVDRLDQPHPVNCLCFSPDGKMIATGNGSEQEPISIWDLTSRSVRHNLAGHKNNVNSVAFGKDGEILISGSSDKRVIIWNIHSGEKMDELKGHDSGVNSVCIRSDCRSIVSGSDDGVVKTWNLDDPFFRTASNRASGNKMTAMKEDANRRQLIAGTTHGEIRFFDIKTLKLLNVLKDRDSLINSLDLSADGSTLVCGSEDGCITIWDLNKFTVVHRIFHPPEPVSGVFFDREGKRIIAGTYKGGIFILDAITGKEVGVVSEFDCRNLQFGISADETRSKFIAYDIHSSEVVVFSGNSLQVMERVKFPGNIRKASISRFGELLLVADSRNGVYVSKLSENGFRKKITTNGSGIFAVSFSYDNKSIIIADASNKLKRFDVKSGSNTLTINDHSDATICLLDSKDGTLYTGGWEKTIRRFSVALPSAVYDLSKRLNGGPRIDDSDLQDLDQKEILENFQDEDLVVFTNNDSYLKIDKNSGSVTLFENGSESSEIRSNYRRSEIWGIDRINDDFVLVNRAGAKANNALVLDWFNGALKTDKYFDWVLCRKNGFKMVMSNKYHLWLIGKNIADDGYALLCNDKVGIIFDFLESFLRFPCRMAAYNNPVNNCAIWTLQRCLGKKPATADRTARQRWPESSFAVLKADHSVIGWCDGARDQTPRLQSEGIAGKVKQFCSNQRAFAILRKDGSVTAWGEPNHGGDNSSVSPLLQAGVVSLTASRGAFTALKNDGSVIAWGSADCGGDCSSVREHLQSGVACVRSNDHGFVATKKDGAIVTWGNLDFGELNQPLAAKQTASFQEQAAPFFRMSGDVIFQAEVGVACAISVKARGDDLSYRVVAGILPEGLELDQASGLISGTPLHGGEFVFTIVAKNMKGQARSHFTITVSPFSPSQRWGASPPGTGGSGNGFWNGLAFAAIHSDGRVISWGKNTHGGMGSPISSGYERIFATYEGGFAAMKSDGSISVWGNPKFGGVGGPTGQGFVQVFSTQGAFAALHKDGRILCWGHPDYGGGRAFPPANYKQVISNGHAFAAIRQDGTILAWGHAANGGVGAPPGGGFVSIVGNTGAFTSMGEDGSLRTWGNFVNGAGREPRESGFVRVYASDMAFAALKKDGSIKAWGESWRGGNEPPSGGDFVEIYANGYGFAALRKDGTIRSWGEYLRGGGGAPAGPGYVRVSSTNSAYAALRRDGAISVWGESAVGGDWGPTASGYGQVTSTLTAFAALKADGSVQSWGESSRGGRGAPLGSGFNRIFSTHSAFAAMKADGSIRSWGMPDWGGAGAPTGNNFLMIHGASISTPYFVPNSGNHLAAKVDVAFSTSLRAIGHDVIYSIHSGKLPTGLFLDRRTGVISGTPTQGGAFRFQMRACNAQGRVIKHVAISVSPFENPAAKDEGLLSDQWIQKKDIVIGPAEITEKNNDPIVPGLSINACLLPSAGIKEVFSTRSAFAAIRQDDSAIAWGHKEGGGDTSKVAVRLKSGVLHIFSTADAFAALKKDGSVVTWGKRGGDSSGVASQIKQSVVDVFSNDVAFVALKSDGSVVTWGDWSDFIHPFVDVPEIESRVVGVFSTKTAFAALGMDGSVVTWGARDQGGDSSQVAWELRKDVVAVYGSNGAFAALRKDGSVVTWGDPIQGGNSTGVAAQLRGGVRQIFASSEAFAALKEDGSVVTWGNPEVGGDSSQVARDISSSVVAFVSPVRQSPWFISSNRANFVVGESGEFQIEAKGTPDQITYSVAKGKLPKGMILNWRTGAISGTPTFGAEGVHRVTIAASNGPGTIGNGTRSFQEMELTVNRVR